MKLQIKLAFVFISFSFCSMAWSMSPLEVVNARMAAHNQHDLEAFLSNYSDNIQIYDYPDISLGSKGKDHIKNVFSPLFESKSVKVTIHKQMANGNYVVNRETVVREGKTTDYISIYEVEDGLIQSVRFIK